MLYYIFGHMKHIDITSDDINFKIVPVTAVCIHEVT